MYVRVYGCMYMSVCVFISECVCEYVYVYTCKGTCRYV